MIGGHSGWPEAMMPMRAAGLVGVYAWLQAPSEAASSTTATEVAKR
jgi:hypothetical protein